MKAKEKIKQILESTFAYNVENDRVASEINSLYANQQPQSQSAEDYWHTKPKKFKEIVGYSTQHLLEFAKEYANQKALTVSDEWISVEDRFPEQDQSVLISDTNDVYKAWYSDKNFFVENFGEVDNVTHWQPLPTPPINKE